MKKKNRILVLILALLLVFAVFFTIITSAATPSEDELKRQDEWEILYNQVYSAEDILSRVGDSFTHYYLASLKRAADYARSLCEDAYSTYDQLHAMNSELSYMIKEQNNPANHERAGWYTVAFTNVLSWSEPIFYYVWDAQGNYEQIWPGNKTPYKYTNSYGQKVYYTYVSSQYDHIIFKNNFQTVDIPISSSMGFYPTGETDEKGNYMVASYELTAPVYKEYGNYAPTEPESSVQPATEAITQEEINKYLPAVARQEIVEYYGSDADRTQLCNLIMRVDSQLLVPGNTLTEAYVEKLSRTRNFAASIYNHQAAADHELIGAYKALQLAVDNGSYSAIVTTLRHYFFYFEDEQVESIVTEFATQPSTQESTVLCSDPEVILSKDYKRGDTDGDGVVSIADVTAIQRLLAELDTDPDGSMSMRGDVSQNGLDILDATLIQRYLAQLGDPFGIGEMVAF